MIFERRWKLTRSGPNSFLLIYYKELRRSVKRQRKYLKLNEKSKYIDEDMSFHACTGALYRKRDALRCT
jgi:hypothetical protein